MGYIYNGIGCIVCLLNPNNMHRFHQWIIGLILYLQLVYVSAQQNYSLLDFFCDFFVSVVKHNNITLQQIKLFLLFTVGHQKQFMKK